MPVTLSQLRRIATARLAGGGNDEAELDAQLLFRHALNLSRTELLFEAESLITDAEQMLIDGLIERRLNHEPVSRIIGQREFYGLNFGLNAATLDPRPDSETLIDVALKSAEAMLPDLRILDLGTGSGCLLLTLLHELPQASGLGIDAAPEALTQAELNALKLNLDQRAQFRLGNWLQGIDECFDLVIANPPYIVSNIILGLAPEVRDFDPPLALDGGFDGLEAYRAIIKDLDSVLTPAGIALFEIGFDQADTVTALLQKAGFIKITTFKDYGGNDRCLKAQR